MSFVGAHNPRLLSTTTIAKWVDTHPTRARQVVSLLVKAELLTSSRGGAGGVRLAKSADAITLLDVYDAVGDTEVLQFSVGNPFSKWADHCSVHGALMDAHKAIEEHMRREFGAIKLSEVFVPSSEPTAQLPPAKKRGTRVTP